MYESGGGQPKKPHKEDKKPVIEQIAKHSEAFRDYEILEAMEAGIKLTGTEVKSLRNGKCNLKDSYGRFDKGELFVYNIHIAPYAQGNIFNHEPTRARKLLLHKNQLQRFFGRMTQSGLALIPLKIYFKHGLAKCEIALAKSKKSYDHRTDIKKKEMKREIDRAVKSRNRR